MSHISIGLSHIRHERCEDEREVNRGKDRDYLGLAGSAQSSVCVVRAYSI